MNGTGCERAGARHLSCEVHRRQRVRGPVRQLRWGRTFCSMISSAAERSARARSLRSRSACTKVAELAVRTLAAWMQAPLRRAHQYAHLVSDDSSLRTPQMRSTRGW